MKFSCITTVFNEGRLLSNSVESVLAQTHGDFEYLIVDDGSGQATREILAEYRDDRIRVVRQANDGLSSARNRALGMVTGEYVCFLDADDTRPVWAFESIARTLRQHDEPDLVICRGLLSEHDGRLGPFYDGPVLDALAMAGAAPDDAANRAWIRTLVQLAEPQSANKVVRAAMIRDRHLRFPNTHFFEDIHFHTMAAAHARRIACCDSPCFTYYRRQARSQITSTRDALRFDVIAVVRMTLDRFAAAPGFADPLHRAAVLLSCFKLLHWCEEMISHHHKHHFRQMVTAMLCLVDAAYLHLPATLPAIFDNVGRSRPYLNRILSDPRLSHSPARGNIAQTNSKKSAGFIQRLWPGRHA